MKKKRIGFVLGNKKINLEVSVCNFFNVFRGLMFRKKKNARALLFEFNKKTNLAIHSYFVFFNFYAVWLDDKNKIIEIKKIKPFQFDICPKEKFSKLVEIPICDYYSKIVQLLDGD